ncbi:MAG: sugar transferase, partial [Proteobacteria bacterium]|nr:sugar transferase [Pseudomonadota bacterium]
GLTGWAQVKASYASSEADTLVKFQYDLYYLRHRSVYLDLLIVLKTVGVVLGFRGT